MLMNEVIKMPIEWRLAVVMAERRVNNKELSKLTGLHHVTISRHRRLVEMPDRLDRKTLSSYCRALKCQPGDLLVYSPARESEGSDCNG